MGIIIVGLIFFGCLRLVGHLPPRYAIGVSLVTVFVAYPLAIQMLEVFWESLLAPPQVVAVIVIAVTVLGVVSVGSYLLGRHHQARGRNPFRPF